MPNPLYKYASSAASSIGLSDKLENLYRIILRGRNAIKADQIKSQQASTKDFIYKTMQGRDGQQYPLHVIVLTDPEWFEHKQSVAMSKVQGTLEAHSKRQEAALHVSQNPLEFL